MKVSSGKSRLAKIRVGINFTNTRTFLFEIFPTVLCSRQRK